MNAIRRAADGESVMSEAMTAKLMAQFRQGGANGAGGQQKPTNSPRASEILVFIARGDSNKEIARTLDLAEKRGEDRIAKHPEKLSLSSRVQAAVFAVEHGLADSRP